MLKLKEIIKFLEYNVDYVFFTKIEKNPIMITAHYDLCNINVYSTNYNCKIKIEEYEN